MKSLRKKLFVSIFMVALAFASTVTSTYAWFTMNKVVTATGFEITAKADSSLLISTTGEDGTFFASVDTEDKGNNIANYIAPTTYDDSMNFFKLTDKGSSYVKDNGKVELPSGTLVEENDYYTQTVVDYYDDDVWLLYSGSEDTKDLKVKIVWVSETVEAIKGSLHLAILDDSNALILDIDITNEGTYYALTALENNVPKKLTLIAYISGEDDECKNANISTENYMEISVNFSIEEDEVLEP